MGIVKFLDLQGQYQTIKADIDRAVIAVLESSQYVLGPAVQAFEAEFAEAHGAAHGVAVNTGTSALHVALLAAGVGPGDEVIAPSMTFTATIAAISYTGATPVFVDVDPETFTIDPALIEASITPRTKAIMPVHLYGQAADMDPIMALAAAHDLIVIEDAAQAHLAKYKGRTVGGIGHMGAFSFYPGKNLGAYGEGGLTTANDPALAQQMRLLRDWGQQRKYHHEMLAYNYRMDGIQGAILGVKFKHLAEWTRLRRERAALYDRLLDESGIEHCRQAADREHVYHIYSVFVDDRDGLQKHLADHDIQSGIHYPIPVHLQQAYSDLGGKVGDFPVTERVANRQLSLPMYPEMPLADVERVVDAVRSFCR